MSQSAPIYYHIIPRSPEAHLFEVTCKVTQPTSTGQIFSLPNWIPGSYLIRDFAKHIITLSASCAGKPLVVSKISKNTWQCAPCEGAITLTYTVYAWDLSVRGAHLDTTHGFFNATSVFLSVAGQEEAPCEVEIVPPQGALYTKWQVATALPEKSAKRYGFGSYLAENYTHLIDCPVEMGTFTLLQFNACGVPHEIAITGRHKADTARLCRDVQKICEYHIRFFGEPAPFSRYIFLVTVLGEGHGGLEHRSSSALQAARNKLPLAHQPEMSDGYCELLGLFSHEYFHAWHVKRIKPAVFTPYDLNRECYTRLLWVFEGITSYYDELALIRTRLISETQYLKLLAQTIARVYGNTGHLKQSVTESSFDAWIKLYQPNENSPNAGVSYYAKGSLVALALDLLLRQKSGGKYTLDDVMQVLWQRYGKTGVGVPENVVEAITAEIAGADYQDFFEAALYSTQDLKLKELFTTVGARLTMQPSGGEEQNKTPGAALGVTLAAGEAATLMYVYEGGAAQAAGLSAGDVIVAIDGLKTTASSLAGQIASHPVGDTIQIHAFRRDELMTFTVKLQAVATTECRLVWQADEVSEEILRRREQWLYK